MEVFVRFTLLLLCFATSSGAAPTDNNGYSAITGSSDAWASLVANVVPLLILVGEKNVKSYFKTISQPSQAYLYAASPIGLVTAIVTAIRLGNSPFMKRLIGRQYEGRAEVLADVTSISGGNVGFELKGPRNMLEQTINPKPKDEAHFWISGRSMGTGREGLRFRDAVEAIVQNASTTGHRAWGKPSAFEVPSHEPLHTTKILNYIASRLCGCRIPFASRVENRLKAPSTGTQDRDNTENDLAKTGREPWWLVDDIPDAARICEATVVTVFDAGGPNAREMTRLYAAHWARCGSYKDVSINHDEAEDCDTGRCHSRSLAYLNWPDVSHTLTTTVNVQVPLLYFSSLIVIALCLSTNAALVVFDWRARRDVMTTIFVSLGLLGSYSFSVWTALLVGRSTRQATIPVKDIQPFRAGFLSTNFPLGVRMAYSPKKIVMSMERSMRSHDFEEGPFWYIPLFVVMSTASFLTLYLGLRSAEWWLPFAMFGNVGFATCMRAILTINSPLYGTDWHKRAGPTWSPNTLYGPSYLWLLHLCEDLQMKEERPPSSTPRRRARQQREAIAKDTRSRDRHETSFAPTSLFSRLKINRKAPWDKPQLDQTCKHNDPPSRQTLNIPAMTEPLLERWTVVATSRYVTGLDNNEMRMLVRDDTPEGRLVRASLAVACVVAESHLLPHDFSFSTYPRDGSGRKDQKRARLHLLRSEFISQNGVWQQPLEIAVRDVEDGLPPEGLVITLLRTWAVQAFCGGQKLSNSSDFSQTATSKRYARVIYSLLLHLPDGDESADTMTIGKLWQLERQALDEGFPGICRSKSCRSPSSSHAIDDEDDCSVTLDEFPAGGLDPVTAARLGREIWSHSWMLWMAVKVVLALSGLDALRLRARRLSGADNTAPKYVDPMSKWHGSNWARDYVDYLKAAGLLKPTLETPVTITDGDLETRTSPEHNHPSIRNMSSPTQQTSLVPPGSTSCTVPDGGGFNPDNAGYMSFG